MHVLYFHQHFTTLDGSSGTRSYEFARALVARGHRVTMVCGMIDSGGLILKWNDKCKWHSGTIDGIEVIAMPLVYSNRDHIFRRARMFLRFAWRSIGIALRLDYDLLFSTSTPLTAALPGIAMKVLGRKKPFVFEVRDLWPELPRALGLKNPFLLGGMSGLEWVAYRCSDICVGLSPGIVEGIRNRAPLERRIEMIPNGCDLELFTPQNRVPLELAGVQSGDFVAGFTGAHGVANGLEALLDAAAQLKLRNRTKIKLLLIGDGKCKPMLQARALAEGLDNCIFIAPIKKAEIAKITASFDCGLQILADVPAFYYGTSPNKFFDYISAGQAVVNNYPGWLADMIKENQCGIAVPPRNPIALADALCWLADNPRERAEMGARARTLAESIFNRHKMADQFSELIESALLIK